MYLLFAVQPAHSDLSHKSYVLQVNDKSCIHFMGLQDHKIMIICCLHLSLRNKYIGDAGAQTLANSLQYYTDIQKLE